MTRTDRGQKCKGRGFRPDQPFGKSLSAFSNNNAAL